jgi:asparagine synthase (glutamine-hydrolysing)
VITEKEYLDSIPEVIRTIESYDTTTVRASVGNYLLGKYIAANSDAKVIFNGDGADELCGGYLYMHKCPDPLEYDCETRRLLTEIHMFDVLRSDRCISSHGLEPRTPFLDRSWVDYYSSIDPRIRYHSGSNKHEKWLLRTAFSKEYFVDDDGKSILPETILWRRKEAFSDGVSVRSIREIIEEYVDELSEPEITSKTGVEPETKEQRYYKSIFEQYYPYASSIVSHYWMPRYVEAKDPSARTLEIYSST